MNLDMIILWKSGNSSVWGLHETYNNPEITWEKTAITDIGLDFSLLNGRFSGTLDYFINILRTF